MTTRALALALALSLAGCGAPRSARVEAAEAIVAAHEAGHMVDQNALAAAQALLAAQPDPWWLDLLYGAASVYGLQALLPQRGRQLTGQALRSGARLDVVGVVKSLAPLVLGSHSGPVLGDPASSPTRSAPPADPPPSM